MVDIERRVAAVTLELREGEGGRTLYGMAVPYGSETRVAGYAEKFVYGAFADAEPEHVPVLAQHDHESLPVGRAISLTETPAGLEASLRISRTRAGDDALELVKDGAVGGLSVGFVPLESRWNRERTMVERTKARLIELSLVTWPAYESARILAIRAGEPEPARAYRLNLARYLG